MQGAGGLLHNRHETYQAARKMVASLGDKYSEFLAPDQVSCTLLVDACPAFTFKTLLAMFNGPENLFFSFIPNRCHDPPSNPLQPK